MGETAPKTTESSWYPGDGAGDVAESPYAELGSVRHLPAPGGAHVSRLCLSADCLRCPPARGGPLYAQTSSADPVVQLLEALTNAPGPSGFEGPVRDLVVGGLGELGADDISYDGLGSVIGRFDGPPESRRVMVTAHLDEVGLMVQYIHPNGFIKFKTLGG